jgi:hypothetical protein
VDHVTRIVPPSLTPCGLAIDDRPHGWSPRLWRGRVRERREVVTTTRQAPAARLDGFS